MSTKKNPAPTQVEQDPYSEAKNALRVYESMRNSLDGFRHLLDYHEKSTRAYLKKMDDQAEKADKNQTNMYQDGD